MLAALAWRGAWVTLSPRVRLRDVTDAPTRGGLRAAWPWFLLAGALTLWTFAGRGGSTLPTGRSAPALQVASTVGDFDLAAREGHVVVLAFWATWCAACRAEGPVLSRVHRQLEARGDGVMGVSVDTMPLGSVADAARRLGMTYPIAVADHAVVDRFEVEVLPTIYVIGPDGRVARTFTGGVGEAALLEAVEEARSGVSAAPAPRRSRSGTPRTVALR